MGNPFGRIGRVVPRLAGRVSRALRANEFGFREIHLPWLRLRRSRARSLALLGRRVEIVEPSWAVHDFVEIFWHQIYRFDASRPDPLILDCGANVGLASIYFKSLYPQSRVVAFEADPGVFQLLERNLRRFELDVTAVNRAVWTEETTMSFVSSGGVGGHLGASASGAGCVTVKTDRLRERLNERVDLLKIDIEGAELDVLRDCEERLSAVDNLFVEFHGDPRAPQTLHELLALLQRAGFRYYVKEARSEERPLEGAWRRQMYDLQMNVFAVRG